MVDEKNARSGADNTEVEEKELYEEIRALRNWLDAESTVYFSEEDVKSFCRGSEKHLTIGEDFSRYDGRRCNNGGCYGFWQSLNRRGPGRYFVTHHTTAEFEYCNACGSFVGHDPEACGYEEIDLRSPEKKMECLEK